MMNAMTLLDTLRLTGRAVAITRLEAMPDAPSRLRAGCSLAALWRVFGGETLYLTAESLQCAGAGTGFGLSDEMPPVPGGVGPFLAAGRGAGYPAGERVKRTAEIGEATLRGQPKGVMDGYRAIEVAPYREGMRPDTVTLLANPDQLSTLVHLFAYERTDYDNVIAPMVSGCASVFRIPFAEAARGEDARAVIGNVDVFSRPHFPADSFFFTVPGKAFARMVEIAGESVIVSPIFKGVKGRLDAIDEQGLGTPPQR